MKALIDFFQYVVQLVTVDTIRRSMEVSDEASPKEIYEWFLKKLKDDSATDVAQSKDPFFTPGKIYVFKYKPLYAEKYAFWDEHPVVLSLGKMPAAKGQMNVGLNLSWFPPKVRVYMMNKIKEMYHRDMEETIKKYPMDATRQKAIPLDLYRVKLALDQMGFSWAIRNYLPSQIESPSVVMAYEHWHKMPKFDIPNVFPEIKGKANLFTFYKEFEEYVKYCRTNSGMLKKKAEKSKKLNKFNFIK